MAEDTTPGGGILERLPDLLADTDAYPHDPGDVRVVQTHISVVAIVPPWVYKVKKPVSLGFLDFSTLDKRRRFCRREVALNRRLTDGVYEGVVGISEREGRLRVEDDHNVVEVAVKMRYLDEDRFLHRRIDNGDVTPAVVDRIVEKLRRFYRSQEPSAEIAEWGRAERLRKSTDENFVQMGPLVGHYLGRPAFNTLRRYNEDFFHANEEIFEQRRADGRILDCHGDLRLEHIHDADGELQIFDCIEFNDRFRYIDVANDIAFLAMDFDFHGRPDLGARTVRRVADSLSDDTLLRVVDFYKCYRACVRGKVQAIKSGEPEVNAAQRRRSGERARAFFRLALAYATCGSGPVMVAVTGRVGTGKSRIARLLSEALGWPVYASDRIRKRLAGQPPTRRGGARERAALYSDDMTRRTYAQMRRRALEEAEGGRSAILDGTYGTRRQRDELREALRERDIAYCMVELRAPDDIVKGRLAKRSGAGGVVSDARLEDFERLDERYEAPDALEDERHIVVDTADLTPEAAVSRILHHMSGRMALP